jgi:hypothetical protein
MDRGAIVALHAPPVHCTRIGQRHFLDSPAEMNLR